MEIKLNEKEMECLNKIKTLLQFENKNNVSNCSPVHIVYKSCDEEFEGNSDIESFDIKYNISGEEYENLEEIKIELKEELFEQIINKEKYSEAKDVFNLDESGELFTCCVDKPEGFFEARKEINAMLKDIFLIENFTELKEKIKMYYANEMLKDSILFPNDMFEYSEIHFTKKFIPTALFSNKSEAKKYVKQLNKKGIESYLVSKSSKDNKSEIAILRKLLQKIIKKMD